MEVAITVRATEFNFDSTSSSPVVTAPCSPSRFPNFFFSATTSPSRSNSSSLHDFCTNSNVPFDWEEKPGTPKSKACDRGSGFNEDFEFNFSGQVERGSLSAADKLFQGGMIRPLKPPLGHGQTSKASSPKSPRSPGSMVLQNNDLDPFVQQHRGRERLPGSSSGYVHKGSRSLSPLRVSDIMLEQEENSQSTKSVSSSKSNPNSSISSSIFSAFSFQGRAYKKYWKIKDLLLFRSASEGRATRSKDPLKKYDGLSNKETEEVKSPSFRSTESFDSSVYDLRRRGVPVSALELHYTANRDVLEELKRKTFLPYKQGLLGCLGFNPLVHHISRVGSLTRGES